MRDIRFKAKRKDNGEWIDGYLFNNGYDGDEERFFVGYIIIDEYAGTADDEWDITGIDFAEVIHETVCQYTGLNDINGNMIFENDVVEYAGDRYTVEWTQHNARFSLLDLQEDVVCDFDNFYGHELEVIGNIFDNPGLLEGSHD